MHRDIDAAGKQCGFDLLREQPFAARLVKRPILDRVPGGLDDLDGQPLGVDAVGARQPRANLVGLHQCQRAAARPDGREDFLSV